MDHTSAMNDHTAERYLLGELTVAERDAYEEHFFSCPDCAEEIKSASDFIETARHVVQKELRAEIYTHAARTSIWGSWLNWRSILQPIPAAACTLLVMMAGVVGYQNAVTIPQLALTTAPQFVTTFMLHNARSAAQELGVSKGQSIELQFDIPPTKQIYTSYQVSMLAQSNAKVLLARTVPAEDAGKTQKLLVTAGTLRAGKYDVLIEGVNGNSKVEVDRLTFKLTF